jgi:hypothetical protein
MALNLTDDLAQPHRLHSFQRQFRRPVYDCYDYEEALSAFV